MGYVYQQNCWKWSTCEAVNPGGFSRTARFSIVARRAVALQCAWGRGLAFSLVLPAPLWRACALGARYGPVNCRPTICCCPEPGYFSTVNTGPAT